jgi:hypothetical protein
LQPMQPEVKKVFLFWQNAGLAYEKIAYPRDCPVAEPVHRYADIGSGLLDGAMEPEVEATNNGMERELRNPALERKAGRTNKTATGAHRRSVIVSVLRSLRANLENFNLTTVLEEIGHWMKEGMSLFAKQWQAIQTKEAATANTG